MGRYSFMMVFVAAAGCGSVSSVDDNPIDAAIDSQTVEPDAAIDAPPDAPKTHVIFTTSSVMRSSAGFEQFTATCQTLAEEAGLGGDFVPLVFRNNEPLDDRIVIEGPVLNTNGEMVAADADDFFDRSFDATNGFSESGGDPGDTVVWIGDEANNTCANWSSTDDVIAAAQGVADSTTFLNSVSLLNCSSTVQRALQCISQ